jgi:hypothetical protein
MARIPAVDVTRIWAADPGQAADPGRAVAVRQNAPIFADRREDP